ncbi:MAG: RnfABCDGE type electron transport complex subunit D [Planctomycetota bacterium]|nr:RnfABCDGE type electron transport complex subunit D [Planctomycetota bacterium]
MARRERGFTLFNMTDSGAAATIPMNAHSPLRCAPVLSPLHSGIGVGTFLALHVLAATFPLTAGFIIFGWRAVGTAGAVIFSTLATASIWKRIGWRGGQIRLTHCVWSAILLSLMLPPHLFTTQLYHGQTVWPLLIAAGVTLGILCWLLGGVGAQRVQPAVAAIIFLFALFHDILTPRYVLKADHLIVGDVMRADPVEQTLSSKDPWINTRSSNPFDSIQMEPPADRLLAYTSAQRRPDRSSLTVQMLIRDQMPPLEDLIVGGQSTAIGNGSGIAVIIGGLFLLYRGLIDFRIPLLGVIAAMVALLILPIPVIITDNGNDWRWLAFREHYLGWPTAITLVNYEILASPLLLTFFFLANAPGLRPITRRGRSIFGICLGVLAAVLQLYVSSSIGPYVALMIVSLITPLLDRVLRPRTLV